MHSPLMAQVPTTPTAGSAKVKSPSHARVTDPRPTADNAWFTSPSVPYIQRHVTPTATSGITCGRK